jgi:hypothetical protein
MSASIYVNEERTVFVRVWDDGTLEVSRRDAPDHLWGPPVYLEEEIPWPSPVRS